MERQLGVMDSMDGALLGSRVQETRYGDTTHGQQLYKLPEVSKQHTWLLELFLPP